MPSWKQSNLHERAKTMAKAGYFVGGPPDTFHRMGMHQLFVALQCGLVPEDKLLDVGCGMLRGGYWFIHLLRPGHYFAIEPNVVNLEKAKKEVLEKDVIQEKKPNFADNDDFDFTVFGEKFDMVFARSIWSHAAKPQILTMLDSFLAVAAPEALFVTSFLPATANRPGYPGDSWIGRSHLSDEGGVICHERDWIEAACRKRGLRVMQGPAGERVKAPDDGEQQQEWLVILREADIPAGQ